jgi:hypothetical protein
MKSFIASLLVIAAISLSGCGDKEAREYATKLIPVLDSYQEQLSQKIKAEKAFYEQLGKTYENARKADIRIRLDTERLRRSESLGEETARAKEPPSLSQIIDSLQEYATSDFDTTKSLLEEQLNSRSEYLADLEGLEIELKKIKALKEALQELAKNKSDFKKFKGAADTLRQTEEGVTKLLCGDFKKQLDELNAAKADAGTDEKKIEEQKVIAQKIEQLTERMKTKKCS